MKKAPVPVAKRKRGRPRKFAGPSRVVALTLPDNVVRGLRGVHPDLAWAVVTMFEGQPRADAASPRPDVELASVGESQSLIVVNRHAYRRLPGIRIIPFDDSRAFLALEQGR